MRARAVGSAPYVAITRFGIPVERRGRVTWLVIVDDDAIGESNRVQRQKHGFGIIAQYLMRFTNTPDVVPKCTIDIHLEGDIPE